MKVHAPIFVPPPAPPPAPPPRDNMQLDTTKPRMAFEDSLETNAGSEQPAQAGYKSPGGRGGGAARRLPASPPSNPASAASPDAGAPAKASSTDPYAPGHIIDITA